MLTEYFQDKLQPIDIEFVTQSYMSNVAQVQQEFHAEFDLAELMLASIDTFKQLKWKVYLDYKEVINKHLVASPDQDDDIDMLSVAVYKEQYFKILEDIDEHNRLGLKESTELIESNVSF